MTRSDAPRRLSYPWSALLLGFGYRWFGGYLLAQPIAAAASQVVGNHPRGDAVLWEAGGFWLGELIRRGGASIGAAEPLITALALLFLLGWLLPSGALIHALIHSRNPNRAKPPLLYSLAVTLRQWPRLVLVYGITSLLSSLVLASAFLLGRSFSRLGTTLTLDIASQRAFSSAALIGILAAAPILLLLRMIQDALRVAALRHPNASFYAWIALGFDLLRRASARGLAAMTWREILGAAVMWGCAIAAWRLTLEGSSALATAPLHGAGLGCWLLLRCDWLRWLSQRLPSPSGNP